MKKSALLVAALIAAVSITFFIFSRFVVDLLWFGSLGFQAVFTTTWLTMLAAFAIASALSAAVILLNGLVAARAATAPTRRLRNFRIVGRSA